MSWKGRYGILMLAIVDHQERSRFSHYGYPSSSGDKRVQRVVRPFEHPREHFAPFKFMLADSGLTEGHHCVVMFTRARGEVTIRGGRMNGYR